MSRKLLSGGLVRRGIRVAAAAVVVLLIELVRVGLDHVDKVGENFLLLDGNGLEVLHDGLGELRLVDAGPR